MMEKPVRRPMVPPIADNMSTNLAALSLVILSKVVASKKILTYLSFSSGESYSYILVVSVRKTEGTMLMSKVVFAQTLLRMCGAE